MWFYTPCLGNVYAVFLLIIGFSYFGFLILGFVNAAFLEPVGFLEAGVLEDLFIVGVSLTLF